MAELRSGLLWRMDSRTPEAAAQEWETAKERFRMRTGREPLSAYVGERAFDLLDQGARQGNCLCILDDNLQDPWMLMVTAEEPTEMRLPAHISTVSQVQYPPDSEWTGAVIA